jgi:hypothetical protein
MRTDALLHLHPESLWKVTQRRGAVSPERPTNGYVRG